MITINKMETGKLSEYEQVREPQEISIDTEIAISPRSLYREITCPICLDVLTQTRASPECLHRFCKKCLDKVVKKKCPICGQRLPSSFKSFREDPKFDQLIMKVFGGDGLQNNDKLQDSGKVIIAPECEIVLKPLDGQKTRFIKCPDTTTIDHLTKYLSMRPETSKMPELSKTEEYKLCIVANRCQGHYKMLEGSLTLEDVKTTHNLDSNKPLELHFYAPNKD